MFAANGQIPVNLKKRDHESSGAYSPRPGRYIQTASLRTCTCDVTALELAYGKTCRRFKLGDTVYV